MDHLLILYGTTDGQTRKIAGALADELRACGNEVDVVNARHLRPPTRPDDYAGVIIAGSVHAGGYQRSVRRWVRAHREALAGRPTAFVSVCLGVLEHNPATDRELDRILTKFFDETGWRPTVTKIVAGALPFTKYGWLKRRVMRRIAEKQLGSGIDTRRDYEYTDWNDVRAFARAFRQDVLRTRTLRPAV
ncbi:MAG TPA: flavodoxin domain-containing protein [Vicinamibacterales bacterium]|nr:flavodoxin domain-containing protein [Vicinamibacterales bacterium]